MLNTAIILDTDSTATEQIRLYPFRRQCMVFWQSGHYSNHTVRRRDMLRLLVLSLIHISEPTRRS